jgi:hypothetical protein
VNLAWDLKGRSKDGTETLVLAKGVRKRGLEERKCLFMTSCK